MVAPRAVRVAEFLRRLERAHPFDSLKAAYDAISTVLREVEDEMSGVTEDPNAAFASVSDGRMYPPSSPVQSRKNILNRGVSPERSPHDHRQ